MPIDHLKFDCDPQLLRGYLDQELTADQEAELEAHLDQCPRCRERIRESAAEEHWWAAAGNYLKRDDVNQLAESCTIRSRRAATAEADVSHHVVLRQIRDWLDPADDPEYIGRFGGYEIVGVVGCGGMGVVLKGFEPPLNRYVAIKVLSPALAASGAARQRFAREAQAAAAVLHENVIAIHRVDQAHGLPYLVMPFVSGVSLQKRIDDEGPLPLAAILRIGRQIAAGLATAHAQGLVHRDIKPANILLDRGVERVTITDFGLARAADDGSLTKTGVIAGTPQYMSPEQSRGQAIDARSDLFSLGSVLYAMCTGHPPFRAETGYGILRRITDTEPRPVREINPEIPEWFEAIIRRLHAKDPDKRFQTAEELAELLEECLAHVQQPTVVPLPDRISIQKHREISTDRTKTLRQGVLAMIATVAAGFLGLFLWQSTDPPDVSGGWTGEDWGQVVLKETQSGRYEGTYTGAAAEEGGEIDVKWSRLERRFNGTWREGDDRHGKISLRLVDDQLRGAWTTSNKSRGNPGTPKLADLLWSRRIEPAARKASEFVPKKKADAAPDAAEHSSPERQAAHRLAGVWRLERVTYNGKERDGGVKTGRLTFRGNRVQIALMNPDSDADVEKREFRYFSVNPAKSPAEINFYDTGFLVQGIYKLEGDELTLALFGRPEIGRPRSFVDDDAQPDGQTTGKLSVMTFRRVDGSEAAPDDHAPASDAAATASFDITGVVLSDQKTPLADADVRLLETYTHSEKLHAKTRTDREGKFTLKGVPQEKEKESLWRYTLVVSAGSFASRVVFVPYAQKEPIHFELELSAPAALRGRVVDADGSPVAGAMVWTPPLKQFIAGIHSATTDASGHFQIGDLAPWNSAAEEAASKAAGDTGWSGGKAVLRVHHPDHGRMAADYAQVPATLSIRFERPMRVSGRVFDRQSGFAVAGAIVRAGTVAGTSDAEGRYQLTVQPLEKLSVQAELENAKSQSIDLKGVPGAAVTLSDLYLRSPQPRREGDSKVESDVPYQRQLLLSGAVRTDFPERPVWLGVGMHGQPHEVSIMRVHPGTGAEEAGLRAGDRILALNGRTVTEIQEVVDRTIWRNPGEEATLLILRGEEHLTVRVKLTEFQSYKGQGRPAEAVGPASRAAQPPDDLAAFHGVWMMVSHEMGKASPTASVPAEVSVDGERIRVRWTNGKVATGKLLLNAAVSPNQFSFDWLTPLSGIYKLEGDRLTLCYNPSGSGTADLQPADFTVPRDSARTRCVLERVDLKYRHGNGEFSSPLHPTKDSPIQAKLVAKEDRYVFDVRLAKELERFLDENKPKSGSGYTSSGTPPPVDLQLELKNVSDVPVRMALDDEHQASGFELKMTGPGAVRQFYGYLGPSYGGNINRREVVLAPAETHRIPLTRLMGVCFPPSLTKQSDRFQRSHQAFYWTAPGRYSVSGRFWASVRQDASSDGSAPGFFGVVLAEASPVTLDVVQSEPAATSEASEGERWAAPEEPPGNAGTDTTEREYQTAARRSRPRP